MSLDLWLEADLGGPEPVIVESQHWNYTHNVNPMWRRALPSAQSLGNFLKGKQVTDTLDDLHTAYERMQNDPETYQRLNPENGWGDYASALEALGRLITIAESAPLARWGVSQ